MRKKCASLTVKPLPGKIQLTDEETATDCAKVFVFESCHFDRGCGIDFFHGETELVTEKRPFFENAFAVCDQATRMRKTTLDWLLLDQIHQQLEICQERSRNCAYNREWVSVVFPHVDDPRHEFLCLEIKCVRFGTRDGNNQQWHKKTAKTHRN